MKEPPLITANTVLSILAVDYPVHKVACYVSDDGAAMLTFEALSETSEFATKWVPFCKRFNIEPRAPEWYFSQKVDYLKDKVNPEFVRERRAMKVFSFQPVKVCCVTFIYSCVWKPMWHLCLLHKSRRLFVSRCLTSALSPLMLQREYEEFKVRINRLVAMAQKVPEEGWTMQDGTPWPGNNVRDHPGMIQVDAAFRNLYMIYGMRFMKFGLR